MAIGRIPEPGTGIPESIVDAKGDVITATAADTPARLAVGTNNQTLVAASGEATGLKYANGSVSTLTAKGDLLTATAANTISRLAVGTNGTTLVADSAEATGLKWQAASGGGINPNLVINGNFTINQRSYVSAANLASGSYGFDRWKSNFTNTTLTFTSAPAGQEVGINSGGGLQQIVEQANVPAGTYTLSFAGTATGRVYNVGATPPSYAASPISFTADGLANVVVEFTAVSTTKTLSKVKLELGTSASTYVYAGGTIEGELSACQRYYYRAKTTVATDEFGVGMAYATTAAIIQVPYPTIMRAAPTALEQSGTAADYGLLNPGSSNSAANSVPAFYHATTHGGSYTLGLAITGGQIAGYATMGSGQTSNAFLGWSAEL